ncbi:MAG: cytochrome c nitrite reductase small subunit [Oligoflexia bacterium]|nr:cytochrome c nitrite reductase small subunit [Oligoflexia bacterium]
MIMTPFKKLIILSSLGTFVGMIALLMHISNVFSYLSDNPKTCMNCHIMGTEYATWHHSSHRENASCNDCHVPQDNIIKKWGFKAMDGLRHSTVFTLRAEPSAIKIKDAGKKAVQENCIRCHSPLFLAQESSMQINSFNISHQSNEEGRTCWECHQETPHGTIRSISSTPFARVPVTGSAVPTWLSELMKKEEHPR